MIRHYFKTAWRNLVRQKVNSIINVAGLSIGMAAAMLIFLWVKNEFGFDNYHKDAGKIYQINNYIPWAASLMATETSPFLLGEKAKEQIPEVLKVSRLRPMYGDQYFNIKGQFFKEEACAYVDSEWFNMFNYKFIRGGATDFNTYPFSLLLTETKAKKYFGNEDPVGKIMRIDTVDFLIQGVIQDNPVNSSFQFDVLIPIAARTANTRNRKSDESWGDYNYMTFVKLTPTADTQVVAAKIKDIIIKERGNDKLKVGLTKLRDLRFEKGSENSAIQHSEIKVVYIFMVLGIMLLLIACINYVNLTTARATLRAREVSIRKIIGAEKRQLFTQFITESVMLSFISLLVTFCLLQLFLPLFNRFTEKEFSLSFTSPGLWIIAGGTLLLTILLTSIYPAILLSSFKPLSIFRGLNMLQIKDASLRKGLVIAQFTISIVLIVGTIVMYRQLQFINEQNESYNRSQLFSFSIPFKIIAKYEEEQRVRLSSALKNELMSSRNIKDVTLINQQSVIDMKGASSGDSNDWDGRDKEFRPFIAFIHADSNFKNILNLQIKEGRWHQEGNKADEHNSILNEMAVSEFNIHKPVIGQRFTSQGDTGVIIGVVKDFYYKSLHEKIGPVVIRADNEYNNTYIVKTAPGKTKEAQQVAEKVWKQFFPAEPFSYNFLDEEFDKLYHADRKTSSLIWIFSAIAILISSLGLFGLATFTAERRNKEIGIRKILGASVTNIVLLLSKEFVYMVLLSMIIAFPLAWLAMNKWLENFAYRINIAWWIFLTAALIALAIAIITVSFQSVKAAMTNPVKSLKTE